MALIAVLLIAPQVTEFWTKVALLGALWIVCAARPVGRCAGAAPAARVRAAGPLPARRRRPRRRGGVRRRCSCSPAFPRGPRRPWPGPPLRPSTLPQLTVLPSKGVATQIGPKLARQIAGDLVADLRIEADALRTRDKTRAASGRGWDAAPGAVGADRRRRNERDHRPERHVDKLQLELETAVGQEPPIVVATATGTERLVTYHGTPAAVSFTGNTTPFTRTLELQLDGSRYIIVGSRGGTPEAVAPDSSAELVSSGVGGAHLENVAPAVGIDFAAERVPHEGDDGRDRDDGRRRLLGRHRQRRLARPVRRQLLRG